MKKISKKNKLLTVLGIMSRVLCTLIVVCIVTYIIALIGKYIEHQTDNFESCWKYNNEYYIAANGEPLVKETHVSCDILKDAKKITSENFKQLYK